MKVLVKNDIYGNKRVLLDSFVDKTIMQLLDDEKESDSLSI